MLKRGFTLIEILVVIAIIGILSTLAIISYTGVQKSARDTARKSDLKQYQSSLENFANKNGGFYPSYATAVTTESLCTAMSLGQCPSDTRTSVDAEEVYKYQSYSPDSSATDGSAEATQYMLWDKLESVTGYFVVCSSGKTGIQTLAPSPDTSDGQICTLP